MTVETLRVRVLGELDLRLGERSLGPITSARARSLLAYLIVHSDVALGRQRLAFLLWPDSTDGQARTNLRNLLHVVRQTSDELDQFLDITPTTVQWHPCSPCWVDLAEFTALAERAGHAQLGPDERIAALQSAAALYVGDLMEDCYDDWVTVERSRLRDRFVSMLRQLTDALLARGDHDEAILVGRELVRRDPFDESSYRLLMRAHAAAGDRAGAMRTYHECASVLQQELGVTPSSDTRREHAALTRTDEASEVSDTVQTADTLLVGRDTEWERLTRCWHDAEGGTSRLVLITGEAGIGKTRLADELASWCRRRGAAVGHARSYAIEADLGYSVVISWLRTADLADQQRRLSPTDRSELARLLPELGAGRATTPGLVHELDRMRLFEAVGALLSRAGRPVLLVLDDAQWADSLSLQVIHYLLRQPANARLIVVATVRREDLDAHHPLAAITTQLQATDRVVEVQLDRLSRDDTHQLARNLLGNDLDPTSADALYADTEGNPLFVVETLRARADGVGDGDGDGAELSPRLQAVINARILRLSETAQRLLNIAATIGRGFTAELLAAAADVDDLTLVRGLDELWRRDLIREHGADSYDFAHGKIRDVAYDGLSPAVRRRNHLRVAEGLLALHLDDADVISDQVAVNFDRAGQIDIAIAWYQRAARQAQRRSADAQAVRLLERARTLIAPRPEHSGDHRELTILTMLSTALVGADSVTSARHTAIQQRAVQLAADLGVDLEPPMLRSLVMSSLCRNEFDEARAAAEQISRSARQRGDDGLAIEGDYLLGIASFWARDLPGACDHFAQVIDRFRPDQRAEHVPRFGHDPQVVCASRLANALWFLGEVDNARATRDQALAFARRSAHAFSTNVAYVFAALLSIDLGEHDEFETHAAQLREGRDRSWVFDVNATAMSGYSDALAGRTAKGIAEIRSAIGQLGHPNPYPGARSTLVRVLLAAYEVAGDAAAGLAASDEALDLGGTSLWEPEIRRLRSEFLAGCGRSRTDVAQELARAAAVAERHGMRGPARRIELSRSRLLDTR